MTQARKVSLDLLFAKRTEATLNILAANSVSNPYTTTSEAVAYPNRGKVTVSLFLNYGFAKIGVYRLAKSEIILIVVDPDYHSEEIPNGKVIALAPIEGIKSYE
jgi:hypothetical protein